MQTLSTTGLDEHIDGNESQRDQAEQQHARALELGQRQWTYPGQRHDRQLRGGLMVRQTTLAGRYSRLSRDNSLT
jgi:hypothetical protein